MPDKTLYRSVDASVIFGNHDEDELYDVNRYIEWGDDAWSGNGEYVQGLRRNAQQIIDKAIGKTITDKGFMSTTSDKSIAEDFYGFTGASNPVIMKINTNGKARGVNLSKYDKNVAPGAEQKERLLARNTSYTVNKITTDDNHNVIVEVTLK